MGGWHFSLSLSHSSQAPTQYFAAFENRERERERVREPERERGCERERERGREIEKKNRKEREIVNVYEWKCRSENELTKKKE